MRGEIHDMVASIDDEESNLNKKQLCVLEAAIKEAANDQVISLEDFKRELDEWKKQS